MGATSEKIGGTLARVSARKLPGKKKKEKPQLFRGGEKKMVEIEMKSPEREGLSHIEKKVQFGGGDRKIMLEQTTTKTKKKGKDLGEPAKDSFQDKKKKS